MSTPEEVTVDVKDQNQKVTDEKIRSLDNIQNSPSRNRSKSAPHVTGDHESQANRSVSSTSSKDTTYVKPYDDTETIEDPLDNLRHWRRQFPKRYYYLNLYRFASGLDSIHIFIGIVAAILSGMCIPLIIFLFGRMVRVMVLVANIRKSMDCTTESCQQFLYSCLFSRPFEGRPITKELLNEVTSSTMITFSLWVILTAAVYTACSSIYFICWHVAADNQIGRLRTKYFEALLRKDMTWFDTQKDPESVNRLMDHTRRIHEGIGESVPIALNLLTITIFCIIVAFSKAWSLTLLAIGLVTVLVIISLAATRTEANRMIAELRAFKVANDLAVEVFTNAKTVIFYSGHKKEILRYKKELDRDFGKVAQWTIAHAVVIFIYWFVTFLAWAVVIWYGVSIVLHDQTCRSDSSPYYIYDAGDMFIIMFSILFGAGNVYLIVPMVQAIRVACDYGSRIFQVIDGPRGIDNWDTDGISIEPFNGDIEFQDVRFTYPLNKENVILNHFNMNVAGGSHVAIVGMNGCGKTSVFKLITKEYLPDSGFIKIDGQDIRNLNSKWLRSQIGYVPQTPTIFDDTIENNVRMGKPDAAFFEIQEACRRANAHEFIISLKAAYQTKVGSGGLKLTRGQQQRLAIARALVRNPKILLLDEHTSSLDPESESLVLDAIEKASVERTVIIITHRLQVTVNCENIFVMKRGRVVENGTLAHLLRNKGAYSQLASGLIDKPSMSVKIAPPVPNFDGTLINASYLMMLFGVQRAFPSLYNSRLTVNPSIFYVSHIFMKDIVVSNIPTQSISLPVDEDIYILENSDSIKENDSFLTKSEIEFRETGSRGAGDFIETKELLHVVVTNPVEDTEVEGISEILDPAKYTALQVITLASTASYKIVLFICVIMSICMGFVLPIFAVLIARCIEILSNPDLWIFSGNWERIALFKAEDDAVKLFIMFIFLGISSGVAAAIQDFCINMSGYKMTLYLKKKVFAAIIRQDMSFFDNPVCNVGALKNFLSIDVLALRHLVRGMYSVIPQIVVTVIVAISIGGGVYDGNLTAYAVVIALFIAGINFTDSWFARKQQMANTAAMSKISSLIWQVFEGKHSVTTMQLEQFFLDKFTKIHTNAFTERRRITYFRALSFGLSQTSVFWGYAIFIYVASSQITHEKTDFTATIAIGQLIIFGLIFVGSNLAIIPCFEVAIKAGKNLLSVIKRVPKIPIEIPTPDIDCEGEIGFHDVHFWHSYSGGDNPFLRGVTFTAPPGKTVGIVGSSESGKSAYLDLVMRLFDVPSGSVTLDSKNLKDLSVRSLRRLIGYVEREPELFKRTVAENIAYGDNTHKLMMKDIIAAAEKAQMHNFICSLPDGYDTRIGAVNERLSTAQKQRICIARAMLCRPKILLIDEATNNLDREGEQLVLDSLEKVKNGVTCIIVAHRLMTVKKADLIVMMKDGRVSETGTHEQLLRNSSGDYSRLWKSQNPLEDEMFLNTSDPVPINHFHAPPASSPPPLQTPPDANDKKDGDAWQMCGSFGVR